MLSGSILVGGGGSGIIPLSDRIRHLYMSDNNSLNTSGIKDLIGNVDIVTAITKNSDNSVKLNADYTIPFTDDFMTNCFTQYLVCKRPSGYNNTGWEGVLNIIDIAPPTMDVTTTNNCWALGTGAYGYDMISTVNALTYAIIAVVNYYGCVTTYINGVAILTKYGYNMTQSKTRLLNKVLDIHCLAFYEGSQFKSEVETVTNFLKAKYNLSY